MAGGGPAGSSSIGPMKPTFNKVVGDVVTGPELPFDTPPPLSFGFTEAVVHAYRSTKPNSAEL